MGARVANISFGADGESSTLTSAIKEAYDKYGMVIVAASGNDGEKGVTFPARLSQTLAVGSSGIPTDPNARSPFSNWGPEVEVVAPGLNIVSTVARDLCGAWTCQYNQPYAIASGTSFAAPMVTALAALVISHQPYLTPEAVRQIIVGSAAPLPDGDAPRWDGAGRIRMRQALTSTKRFYILGAPGIAHPVRQKRIVSARVPFLADVRLPLILDGENGPYLSMETGNRNRARQPSRSCCWQTCTANSMPSTSTATWQTRRRTSVAPASCATWLTWRRATPVLWSAASIASASPCRSTSSPSRPAW